MLLFHWLFNLWQSAVTLAAQCSSQQQRSEPWPSSSENNWNDKLISDRLNLNKKIGHRSNLVNLSIAECWRTSSSNHIQFWKYVRNELMDDVHLLTARHFRYGKIFSSKFGAREVCIAPQETRCGSLLMLMLTKRNWQRPLLGSFLLLYN